MASGYLIVKKMTRTWEAGARQLRGIQVSFASLPKGFHEIESPACVARNCYHSASERSAWESHVCLTAL